MSPSKERKRAELPTEPEGEYADTYDRLFHQSFGDKLQHKSQNQIRITTLNLNTFPIDYRDESKQDALKYELTNINPDILGMTELNYNWNNLESKDQLHQQTRGWWKNKSIQRAWMKTASLSKSQVGGTATLLLEDMTSYRKSGGSDNSKMGRWSWITITDPQGDITTTIITLYRPNHNLGEFTVYTQQKERLRITQPKHTEIDVYAHYINDLDALLTSLEESQHQIIVMGDFNEDTSKRQKLGRLMEKHHLYNPIAERHGSPTTTHIYGERPIEAIFISEKMTIERGGHKTGNLLASDHKAVWIDIPKEEILGNTTPITRPPYRKLQTGNPKTKKKFNKILEQQLRNANVQKHMIELLEHIKHNRTAEFQHTYEKLDRIRLRCIQHAEKNCVKERRGTIPFSPEIQEAMGRIAMWKLLYKRQTSKGKYKPKWKMIKRKAKKWKFPADNFKHKTTKEIHTQLKEAVKHFKSLKTTAKEKRQNFLEEKAEALAEKKGEDKSKYLKRLVNTEETKDAFRRIRYVTKPTDRTPLQYIEEEGDNGERRKITEKDAMEIAIRMANVAKLTQADNTPLREEPLKATFNEAELDYAQWDKVLDPNFELPPHLEKGTRLWFQQMRNKDKQIPTQPLRFNHESYKESWKTIKEATTSHPGIHFGHMKAMDEDSQLANKLNALLADVPLWTGYSPEAWQKCTDAMIKKKTDDMRPGKLRLITLMHAIFNHNNKALGRHMMKLGEKHNRLAIEQYGSRKHKSAIEHALNKVLTLDISRQKREALIFTANDARSCYDRIVLMAAYCTMVRFGVTKEAAQSMITTIATMEHHIRTSKGDSTRYYGGKYWVRIPHGIGQGNGAGPSIWACVSTPLFDALRDEGYGMNIRSPITLVLLNITGFSFVDDADLIQTMSNMQTDEELFIRAQAQLIIWEQLLRTTGGAIEPSKSDWVFVRYKWNNDEWEYNKKKFQANLMVRNKDKEEQKLRQLSISEARETLGVWIAADGNWRIQKQQLESKAKVWATLLKRGHLNSTDTVIATKATIMKTLE